MDISMKSHEFHPSIVAIGKTRRAGPAGSGHLRRTWRWGSRTASRCDVAVLWKFMMGFHGRCDGIPSGKPLHNYGTSAFLIGKSTISITIFNSYVCLPKGKILGQFLISILCEYSMGNSNGICHSHEDFYDWWAQYHNKSPDFRDWNPQIWREGLTSPDCFVAGAFLPSNMACWKIHKVVPPQL